MLSADLHIKIVVFDATLTKLVQTGAHNVRILIDCSADLAQEHFLFYCVEELWGYCTVVWFVEGSWHSDNLEIV